MQRIIGPNTVAIGDGDVAPSGTPGEATNGDPGAAIPPTTWMAWAWNMIANELCTVVTAAGLSLDATNWTQVVAAIKILIQQETGNYAADTGADGAHYVIAPNPPIAALTDGLPLRFLAAHTSTGSATLAVSGLSPVTIVRDDGSPLLAGDIPASGIANVLYSLSGNKFFLISTVQQNASFLQAQTTNYAADTGADATHYACTLAPALAAHTAGTPIRIKAAHTNTGAATFDPGPGAKSIKDENGNDPVAGMIEAGTIIELKYDGTNYQLAGRAAATHAEVKAKTATNKLVTPENISALVYVSSLFTWAAGGNSNEPHGLGAIPVSPPRAQIVCISAELGYAAGDIVAVGAPENGDRGVQSWADGTTVGWSVGSSGIDIIPKGGGGATNVTAAKWYIRLVASLLQ